MHLTSAFIEWTSGGNGTQGMRVGESVQYHAWNVSRLSRRNHMCGMQGMTVVVHKTCGRVECRNGMLDMCRSCVLPLPP